MAAIARWPQRPQTVVFYLFTFVSQFQAAFYSAFEADEAPYALEYAAYLATVWAVWWWLVSDSRSTKTRWPLDLGMFLYLGWIFLLPYYLFRTRGAMALVGMGVYVGMIIGGWLAATAVIILFWQG